MSHKAADTLTVCLKEWEKRESVCFCVDNPDLLLWGPSQFVFHKHLVQAKHRLCYTGHQLESCCRAIFSAIQSAENLIESFCLSRWLIVIGYSHTSQDPIRIGVYSVSEFWVRRQASYLSHVGDHSRLSFPGTLDKWIRFSTRISSKPNGFRRVSCSFKCWFVRSHKSQI